MQLSLFMAISGTSNTTKGSVMSVFNVDSKYSFLVAIATIGINVWNALFMLHSIFPSTVMYVMMNIPIVLAMMLIVAFVSVLGWESMAETIYHPMFSNNLEKMKKEAIVEKNISEFKKFIRTGKLLTLPLIYFIIIMVTNKQHLLPIFVGYLVILFICNFIKLSFKKQMYTKILSQ